MMVVCTLQIQNKFLILVYNVDLFILQYARFRKTFNSITIINEISYCDRENNSLQREKINYFIKLLRSNDRDGHNTTEDLYSDYI